MAKARTSECAPQTALAGDGPSETQLTANPSGGPTVASLDQGSRAVQIIVPMTPKPPPTEFVFHVDCKLTPEQSTVARRIAQELDRQNACLKNGQRIVNVHGALKWLLEQVAKQL